jgi:hypothetical protein
LSVYGGDLLRHLHITVGDFPADVVASQFARDLSIGDTHIGMMVDRFKVRDQTVEETKRGDKILKLEFVRVCCSPASNPTAAA